jgi:hypothetical protein
MTRKRRFLIAAFATVGVLCLWALALAGSGRGFYEDVSELQSRSVAKLSAYLSFTAVSGFLLGLAVSGGLGVPARRLARLPMNDALRAYFARPLMVALFLVGVVFVLWALAWMLPFKQTAVVERGPGFGIGIGIGFMLIFVGIPAVCVLFGTLLFIGRKSPLLTSATAVMLATGGWAFAGIETFWLCGALIGYRNIDPNAWSATLAQMSTATFFIVASNTVWLCSSGN